ncbi:MAG TPA: DUF2163 domain-containing protein, partial [Gemmobacter sp.]|nr:DUF2163 domain-containing protein [Gemmobacter sp.]
MGKQELLDHLATGTTTVCRAWAVTRADGTVMGFTDHDRSLRFGGISFKADSGLTAKALQQSTGLSVDNTEAMGALSDAAITEADILAGRYDGAEVQSWLVNWADVRQRMLLFRGTLGEITRAGGAFHAELRGLAERLNQVQGRVYHRHCSAVLGDGQCRFDTSLPGYSAEAAVQAVEGAVVLDFAGLETFEDRWFERGRLLVQTGAAAGLSGFVKSDRLAADGTRRVELWQRLGADLASGDVVRLEAGCDKRSATCRQKFNNFLNFRGFPHIPGEDWLTSYPSSTTVNDG